MRRSASLGFFLIMLSVVVGFLLSTSAQDDIIYQEYEFLKEWWIGGLLVFVTLIFLFAVQSVMGRILSRKGALVINIIAILLAIAGWVYTYMLSFREGVPSMDRFYIGMYLFWAGWMVVSVYLLMSKKINKAMTKNVGAEL